MWRINCAINGANFAAAKLRHVAGTGWSIASGGDQHPYSNPIGQRQWIANPAANDATMSNATAHHGSPLACVSVLISLIRFSCG
jgi:hypothetical protein